MNILCIGDVVGDLGCAFLRQRLPGLKKLKQVDLVIANGENSSDTNGIMPGSVQHLLDSGVDVITGGNHSFQRREIFESYDSCEVLLRPANYPQGTTPGRGVCVADLGRMRVAVINLMGTVFMDALDNPFAVLDRILADPELPRVRILDFHAEATGEKRAMGFYADGRVSAMFGTHTHVQTADEGILPRGTGYITDVGMTGVIDSAIGMKPETVIRKLALKLPSRFELAKGDCRMDCALFTVDEKTGLCTDVERLSIT